MKKRDYRGARCEKRSMSKCKDGVAKFYNTLESYYASCVIMLTKKEETKMSENKRLLTDDESAKVTGGLVIEYPDGWYVCTDPRREKVYGPFKDEEKACSVAAHNGYSYDVIRGPFIGELKEDH